MQEVRCAILGTGDPLWVVIPLPLLSGYGGLKGAFR